MTSIQERSALGIVPKEKKQGKIARYMARNRASENYLIKKDFARICGGFFMVVLLFGLCFLILQPILFQISNSFMSRQDLFDSTVISVPRYPTLVNYRMALNLMEYWGALGTSLGITFLVALLQIMACTLVAYGFARFEFPFKRFWFGCVLLSIIIPPHVIMAPMFLNFLNFDIFGIFTLFRGAPLSLTYTLTGYLILSVTAMGLRNGLYIFMLRQYFRNMPKELEESAWVDGCGKLRTFAQIMLPDAVPMLVSCFLFAFVWQWTDGFYTNMFLRNYGVMAERMRSLADVFSSYYIVEIQRLQGGHGLSPPIALVETMISTGVLLGVAPIIIIYIIAQRGFVESIGQSGMKM
ncbi:MAG: carbohydrate ABC transporter permease [Defluviitaleaceae bacterium]|nr:carbohydrate ABC transporter permease [Defluviitaleaceae bacterium]MCL2238735.1 carbohydrate ABC transporter permease [Defluviitaleaceae bacterium]